MILTYPMSKLAPLTLLTTVFALLSGYVFFGETLSTVQWISCSMFLAGITVVLYPNKNEAPQKQTRTSQPATSNSI